MTAVQAGDIKQESRAASCSGVKVEFLFSSVWRAERRGEVESAVAVVVRVNANAEAMRKVVECIMMGIEYASSVFIVCN